MLKLPSPALGAIFREIRSSDDNILLDLGEMRAGTFNFFSGLQCKFQFENLREFIIENRSLDDKRFKAALLDYISFDVNKTSFNVVLAWDLLDYLSPAQVIILFEVLEHSLKPDTLVHTLGYMTRNIPAGPSRFTVYDGNTLEIELNKPAIPRPYRHTSMSLVKSLPGFRPETDLFSESNMKTGIKETLLRRVSPKKTLDARAGKKTYSTGHMALAESLDTSTQKNRESHSLPGLSQLLHDIKNLPQQQVIDLGYDSKSNARSLLAYCANVSSVTLASRIYRRNQKNGEKLNSRSISLDGHKKYDAILFWDLLNYLEPDEIREVIAGVVPACKPGTMIHMICYTTSSIPRYPPAFSLGQDARVSIKNTKERKAYKNKITSIQLLKLFENTDIKYSFSMKKGMPTGMYELVFIYNNGALPLAPQQIKP